MNNSARRNIFGFLTCAVFLFSLQSLHAQSSDIDIYGVKPSVDAIPNVLFILDNSSNWNANNGQSQCYYKENGKPGTVGPTTNGKKFSIEQCALYNLIDSLPIGADDAALFNVGFMVSNETNVDSGVRPLKAFTPINAAGKAAIKTIIKNLPDVQSPAPSSFALAMHEAYLYYAGMSPYAGQRAGTPPYDAAAFLTNGKYLSPAAASCGRNFVIVVANGPPEGDFTKDDQVKSLLQAAGGDTTPIVYPAKTVDKDDAANWTDEYARFLLGRDVSNKDGSQNIVTYTIAVTGASSDKATYPEIYKGIAKAGGGEFFEAKTADKLETDLKNIFNQLQAVNSVFSSASLPVSVNARGTYLNQIFMGTFRPDGESKPRWRGNLKQYKFGYDPTTDSLFLTDKNNNPAISGATGFLSPSAVSYWTESSSFWSQQQLGTPRSSSDSPDGEVVEKGGVAQRLRSTYDTKAKQDTRNVLTCLACSVSGTSLGAFNSATVTALSADLVNWVRGADNISGGDSLDRGPGSPVTVRSSVHGDVLHSRPAVVNYGNSGGVIVFYGSNDGTLRAVNGNQAGDIAGFGPGDELWGFIAEEHFPKLNRLRVNTPEVKISTTVSTDATARDYFADGPIGVYQKVSSTGTNEKVYIYAAMRRGGRILYALDVTSPTAPKFLWKKTQSDISVLGYTWSEPKVARIKGHTNPVIIMGAGYDPVAEDVSPQGTTSMGNAILVLDAMTGVLLNIDTSTNALATRFKTDRSVPADVTLVDVDFDGYVDRAYAADMAGHIYRVDFESTLGNGPSNWGMFKLASLKASGTRKFFYPPDVVVTSSFTAVLAGSGDREKPLAATASDAFFVVYDYLKSKGTPDTFTTIQAGSLGLIGTEEDQVAGCYLPMSGTGEKIVNAPLTAGGITYFSTNQPSDPTGNSCSNLGIAKVYSAPLFCGEVKSEELIGGGLPPSPVSGTVTVSYTLPGTTEVLTKKVPFLIGAPNSKGSGIEGSKVSPVIQPVRKRSYWYLDNAR